MYLRQSPRLESCELLKAVIRYLEPGNVAPANRNPVNPVAFIRETPCGPRSPRTFVKASKKHTRTTQNTRNTTDFLKFVQTSRSQLPDLQLPMLQFPTSGNSESRHQNVNLFLREP